MLSTIMSVSALLFSFSILCIGHGLNNTLLGMRATLEHYPEWVTGLMMSGYFLGFIFGTNLCARLIPVVGQIRTFAAFASVASAISLLHVLFVNEVTWIVLRFIYGICIAGLYMVIESWLNALSSRQNRGRILSVYMIINFLSLAIGQVFVFAAEPTDYKLFAIVSILISLALVPLTVSKAKPPESIASEHFSFKRLFTISPLATVGCTMTGLTLGAFWGMAAVYFTQMGFSSSDVALLISATFIGGLVFQWPVGYFSDRFDRRITIAVLLLLSVCVCVLMVYMMREKDVELRPSLIANLLLFGGFSYTLYSLFIALANDFLEPQFAVKASGALIIFHAMGAIFGPILASVTMVTLGSNGLFAFIAVINSALFVFALTRIMYGRKIPEATSEAFVPIPKTGIAVIELDPRQNHE